MQKFLLVLLSFMIAWFNYQAKYGRGGAIDDRRIMEQIKEQTQLNYKLTERNNRMIIQISGLKGSNDSIEQRSRYELNMIKNGETLVILPGNDLKLEKKKE